MDFINRNEKGLFKVAVVVIVLIASFNAFNGLTMGGVYDWDEARHGVNAFEMIENKDYIVHTYDNEPDYWNLKPPLSMWLLVVTFRVFGFNLLGLRILSALLLPITALISTLFLSKHVGKIAGLSTGFLFAFSGDRFHHLFKTGDPDALFLFCCMMACIYLYRAYSKDSNQLIGAGIFTSLSFLTKAMHVAPLVLVIIISLAMLRRVRRFTGREIGLYLILPAVTPSLFWAILRFSRDGGDFFVKMLSADVLDRVASVVENHSGGVGYYFYVLGNLMGGWLTFGILLTLTMALALKVTSEHPKPADLPFFVIFTGMLLCPLMLFTFASTKLGWYIYPCLIGLYYLTGYALQYLISRLEDNKMRKSAKVILACCAAPLLIGLFYHPISNIHVIASPSSVNNIFLELEHPEQFKGRSYYTIDTDGNSADLSQSWLLHAYFLDLHHTPGNYSDYTDNAGGNLLVVSYNSPEEAEAFMARNPHLYLTGRNDHYLLFR